MLSICSRSLSFVSESLRCQGCSHSLGLNGCPSGRGIWVEAHVDFVLVSCTCLRLINSSHSNIFQMAPRSTAYPLPSNLSPATVANTASLLRIIALGLISAAGIVTRLFTVIKFESIHIWLLCVRYTSLPSLYSS